MKSALPKVLHPLCGRPMLGHVIDALGALPLDRIVVVVGHGAERVTKTLQDQLASPVPIEFVEQRVQRGTGDAASVALTAFPDDTDREDDILVLPGDAPLIRPEVLAELARAHRQSDAAAALLTAELTEGTYGFGRVVRDREGRVDHVVERTDASPDELEIGEVNTSIYCFRRGLLAPALRRLSPQNAQGEYYLTDVIAVLRGTGHGVVAVPARDPTAAMHVNDRAQLAAAEQELRARVNDAWMHAGVTIVDPTHTYVDVSVRLEADVRLLPGVILEGRTVIGRGCVIGPDTRIADSEIGEDCVIQQGVIRDSEVGDGCTVGPYASLRAGTRLAAGAHIGTFVEIKNSEVGDGAKVPHLAYVADAEIGPRSNLGAGTITANYDGRQKHRTVIGADVRIGSNTVLRAPVSVGDGAYTGSGAVVTHDVPPGALAKGVPARVEDGWVESRADRATQDPEEEGGGSAGDGGRAR